MKRGTGWALIGAAALACAPAARAADDDTPRRKVRIRAGFGRTIVEVRGGRSLPIGGIAAATSSTSHPRPRLVGFSPLVAITTSDEGNPLGSDFEWEHELESSYVGLPLNPNADRNFIIGFLDSGADVNLIAGTSAVTLGLFGSNLTVSTIPIGGVGGEITAAITIPVGFFVAGLAAIDEDGRLDLSPGGPVVGHSNVCGLAAPPIDCGEGEVVTGVVGMPLLAFYNSIIRVDLPRSVTVDGQTISGPDVRLQSVFEPLPRLAHAIFMEFGGLSLTATTANYFPDFLDLATPIIPTLLSLGPGLLPFGGAFFATILVTEGVPGPGNPAQPMRVLVDTGAQSSIMSRGMAANLSLPFEPDFTVAVCGLGGLVEAVPGYYVDEVKINALGGALEFSQAPFVVLDLPSPESGVLDGILGMNFFWNRNVIFEPNLGGSGFFHVSDPLPVPYADSDVDFDVDHDDTSFYVSCFTGPAASALNPECVHLDVDGDADNDLADFARFQRCFSGAGLTADPDCGD